MVRVLVVEDEANIREMIALNLRLTGMEAVEAESAEAALPLLAKKPGCDAAILDVMLPGMNGFSLCETIRRTDQKIGIIIPQRQGAGAGQDPGPVHRCRRLHDQTLQCERAAGPCGGALPPGAPGRE